MTWLIPVNVSVGREPEFEENTLVGQVDYRVEDRSVWRGECAEFGDSALIGQ
ncbi:hypothetical protein ACL02S_00765 [Nocardia sp. 004]|uniref:hypothetical protein n=1 Tax=Nocardia sp. 004 TaxID=3385978 RepID=UPI00399F1DD6